jgi:hypothetical protein
MRHSFNWGGDGKTVTTLSFDFFNPDPAGSANDTVDGRWWFALNQNTGGLTSGANNLIRLAIGTAPEEDRDQGIFAFQTAGIQTFENANYPLNTLVTAHLILNNTDNEATNSNGKVIVAAKTVQLWTEVNGEISLAGGSTFASGREDSDLVKFGIATPSGYTGEGYVVDNLRYADGITVIPEPSTYAALVGLLALGLVIGRRRSALRTK